jgi:hypothetical protein
MLDFDAALEARIYEQLYQHHFWHMVDKIRWKMLCTFFVIQFIVGAAEKIEFVTLILKNFLLGAD